MADVIRVGIIGAGRIGQVHAKTITTLIPRATVCAISDVLPEAALRLASECGEIKTTSDHRDILADNSISAVMICSSTNTHADLIRECADAGKHIFCEKPIALELAKVDSALNAVARNGVLLMVGFNRRFDAGNMRIRRAIAAGKIGAPELCVISSRDPAPPPIEYIKNSGGLFLDMMLHDFDLARYFLNDEPEEIYVQAGCMVNPEIGRVGDVDTAMAQIKFRSGALCHINNSRRSVYGYDQRAEVFGSVGALRTRNHHENNTVFASNSGFSEPPLIDFFMERYLSAYQEEDRVFIECVANGRQPPATGADGRMAVVMGLAAKKALAEARSVKMSEFGMMPDALRIV